MALPMQFFYVFALPIMVITGGGTGIITAIIIAVGLRQAWQMPTFRSRSSVFATASARRGGNVERVTTLTANHESRAAFVASL